MPRDHLTKEAPASNALRRAFKATVSCVLTHMARRDQPAPPISWSRRLPWLRRSADQMPGAPIVRPFRAAHAVPLSATSAAFPCSDSAVAAQERHRQEPMFRVAHASPPSRCAFRKSRSQDISIGNARLPTAPLRPIAHSGISARPAGRSRVRLHHHTELPKGP
jgi:hypothetical protein